MSNGYVAVPGVNDDIEYQDTLEAMNVMGMPEEEQGGESRVYLETLSPLKRGKISKLFDGSFDVDAILKLLRMMSVWCWDSVCNTCKGSHGNKFLHTTIQHFLFRFSPPPSLYFSLLPSLFLSLSFSR